jgi:hypothetical protein
MYPVDRSVVVTVLKMFDTLCEVDPPSREIRGKCTNSFFVLLNNGAMIEYNAAQNTADKVDRVPDDKSKIIFYGVREFIGALKNPADKLAEYPDLSLVRLFQRMTDVVYSKDRKEAGDRVMFLTTVRIAVALGDCEEGRELALRVADGLIQIVIHNAPDLTINILCREHRFEIQKDPSLPVRARIEYADIATAAGIVGKTRNQFILTVHEEYVVRGFIPMIDAFEKLLSRANGYIN